MELGRASDTTVVMLSGDEVAEAVTDYLNAHGVHFAGARTVQVNGEPCRGGQVIIEGVVTRVLNQRPSSSLELHNAEPLARFFCVDSDEPLSARERAVWALFRDFAFQCIEEFPRNAERTVMLREIIVARDAALRAVAVG